jgi:uncharacterized protein YdeI (YjbR/CyaY-like superfamily)
MNQKNPKVDKYVNQAGQWQEEIRALRRIILETGLDEELKWGKPCYTFESANIVLIQGFKSYFALMFFKGTLLKDPAGILVKAGQNQQSALQVRFSAVEEITALEPILKDYIREAVEVEKTGLQVELKETSAYPVPEEFQQILNGDPELKTAFEALAPGRQRGYLLYFSQAKQSKTRAARVERYRQQILDGIGLNDRKK